MQEQRVTSFIAAIAITSILAYSGLAWFSWEAGVSMDTLTRGVASFFVGVLASATIYYNTKAPRLSVAVLLAFGWVSWFDTFSIIAQSQFDTAPDSWIVGGWFRGAVAVAMFVVPLII